MNKYTKAIIILLTAAGVLFISGTVSYYLTDVRVVNEFKTMTYNVKIGEEFNNTWGTKKVSFINEEATNTPVVLRMSYNELWRKEIDGELYSLDNNYEGVNVVTKTWTEAFDDFEAGEDGWYYYKKVLNAQSSVQVLEAIALNETLISSSPYAEEYQTYNYELDFNFEAIQATTRAISEIWGKNVTIDRGRVNW